MESRSCRRGGTERARPFPDIPVILDVGLRHTGRPPSGRGVPLTPTLSPPRVEGVPTAFRTASTFPPRPWEGRGRRRRVRGEYEADDPVSSVIRIIRGRTHGGPRGVSRCVWRSGGVRDHAGEGGGRAGAHSGRCDSAGHGGAGGGGQGDP